ncbi:MAG: hypothetical protein K5896_00930 [Prevotella sp.]|nr:hypothetical protein [Prevotella sp.]
MEKNELSLNRPRSFQAVLSDGLRLYASHIWCLVRSSWVQAIVYALAVGFSMAYFFTYLLPLMMGHRSLMPELAIWGATFVVYILAALLLSTAGAVAPLQQHSKTDAITAPSKWWGRWPWKLSLRSIIRLPQMLWTVMRHQPGVFVSVSLILLLLVLVATLAFMLPAVVMAIADTEVAAGKAAGDAVEMPENLFQMNFITFTICGLLQAYIHLATLFPLYYLWGNGKVKK